MNSSQVFGRNTWKGDLDIVLMSSNGAEESVGIDMDDGQAVENEPEDGEGKNEMGEIIWSMKYKVSMV